MSEVILLQAALVSDFWRVFNAPPTAFASLVWCGVVVWLY